ncbi:phosphatidylglycerophosphatase [Pannonibacter sp. Q-1]|uniref:hypothetical protein n=1 Tax=Pannonibacter TaxID=227873 RepID=UPI00067D9989|nr:MULTISPECIES: hypothetical protein [Pannonibacter]
MIDVSAMWADLFEFAGLLNPIALVIGAVMGYFAAQRRQIIIAAFAAAVFSLMADALLRSIGLPQFAAQAGPLAAFPFRFAGGGILALVVHLVFRRKAQKA